MAGLVRERECGWKIKTHPALSSRAAENTGEQLQISSLQWLQNLKSRVEHWLLTPPASDHFEGINHWSQDSVLRTLHHHQPQIVATFLEIYSWHHDRTRIVKNYVFNTHFDADSSVIFVPEKDSLAELYAGGYLRLIVNLVSINMISSQHSYVCVSENISDDSLQYYHLTLFLRHRSVCPTTIFSRLITAHILMSAVLCSHRPVSQHSHPPLLPASVHHCWCW